MCTVHSITPARDEREGERDKEKTTALNWVEKRA